MQYIEETNNHKENTTMFYDGSCPLCRREVNHYIKVDIANSITWVDITTHPEKLSALNISYDKAMARLHVLDTHGEIQTGARAFLTLWKQLPYYRWLAKILISLRLHNVIEKVYQVFAKWRIRNHTT